MNKKPCTLFGKSVNIDDRSEAHNAEYKTARSLHGVNIETHSTPRFLQGVRRARAQCFFKATERNLLLKYVLPRAAASDAK